MSSNIKNLFLAILNIFRQAADARQREQEDIQRARQREEDDAQHARKKEQDDAEHARQLEMRKAELEAEVQKQNTKEEEEIKRWEAEERNKQLGYQAKIEQMKERTRQLELESAINDTKADLEVKQAQEKTKQVRISQLEHVAKIVTRLADIGTDKATINAQLRMMLGGELPPEKIEKVSLPPPPNTIQFKFLENMTKEQPKASKRKIERQRVRTAPVTVGFD